MCSQEKSISVMKVKLQAAAVRINGGRGEYERLQQLLEQDRYAGARAFRATVKRLQDEGRCPCQEDLDDIAGKICACRVEDRGALFGRFRLDLLKKEV